MGLYLAAGLNDLLILIVHNHNARSPFHPGQRTIVLSIIKVREGANLQLPDGKVSGDFGGLHLAIHGKHHLFKLKGTKVRLRGGIAKPSSVWRKRETKVKLRGLVPDITNVLGGGEGRESGSLALIVEPGQGRNVSGGRVTVLSHQWDEGGRVASLP